MGRLLHGGAPHDGGDASSDPAESRAYCEAGEALGAEPKDGGEMEKADACVRCTAGHEATVLHHLDARGRGADGRVSYAYAAPAG